MADVKILTIETIKEVVCDLGKQYGAERVYLFGSYARGEETAESDVDLRIDVGRIYGWDLGGLYEDLVDALGVSVDLISTVGMNEYFLEEIQKEEVLLYEEKR